MALMLGLSALIGFGYSSVSEWKKGKEAALSLQAVYSAQRAYMADNPTADISVITSAQLTAYLPQGWSALPTFTGLQAEALTLNFTTMPPSLLSGSTPYDPSPRTNDGLWDVGE
jgi:hypothetical protein